MSIFGLNLVVFFFVLSIASFDFVMCAWFEATLFSR